MTRSALLEKLGMDHPVILAPMAGGPGTPELVAAVSNAGGLGSYGAAYLAADALADVIRRIRALTERPFAVNLFAGGREPKPPFDPGPMLAIMGEVHAALGLPPPIVPSPPPDPFGAQLEVLVDLRPAAFSFTFGIPEPGALARVRDRGMVVLGTATTVEEARRLADAGVDAIVAQGAEAGAHRGTFAGPFEASMVPTLELVRGAVAAVDVPVIASGGIMDGKDLAAALGAGAVAGQLGTAFLACPESGAAPAYKQAILAAREDTTVVTRAFSGRPARGLRNGFIARLEGREDAILPFPQQNGMTRAMRAEAARRGAGEYLSLWAGQGVGRARALPAGELVRTLAAELREATAT